MLSFKSFWEGIKIVAKTVTSSSEKGDLEVLDSDSKLYFHNGTVNTPIVTESTASTLTNKDIVAADNIITTEASGLLTATELNAALAQLEAISSGSSASASNVGGGNELFKQQVLLDLQFRTLVAGTNVTVVQGTDIVTISSSGGGSGEDNTASNVGAGTGLFKQKAGTDLEFKTLVAGTNVTITPGTDTVTIAATGGGGSIAVENQGSEIIASASRLNFTGAGVVATDAGGGEATITIAGGGVPAPTSFTLANNQVAAASITGLIFAPASVVGFIVEYSSHRTTSTQELASCGRLRGSFNTLAGVWSIANDYAGDNDGITFSVTALGQVQYTSTNVTGASYVGTLKYVTLISFAL